MVDLVAKRRLAGCSRPKPRTAARTPSAVVAAYVLRLLLLSAAVLGLVGLTTAV